MTQSSAHSSEEIPSNLYKPKDPWVATILKNERLTAADSPNEVRHVQLDLKGSHYRYVDGQSIGVLPEGVDEAGNPHKLRLYSISSPSRGDDGEGQTVSICVKHLKYNSPEGVLKEGVCSTYLSALPVGAQVRITGPVGKSFLLPETPDANLIMVGTGTGIAPFRAFLHTRYHERLAETGQAHLFLGVQYRKDFLYEAELQALKAHPSFHLHMAFSRESKTAEGERLYVQHLLYEARQTILPLLEDPNTYFYVCGLRGMEVGILEQLTRAAREEGIEWDPLYMRLKTEKRWHVEVY
ncbi:MAG: ferredoxin--NADP(+) reductase [Vampirovibrio sp.]